MCPYLKKPTRKPWQSAAPKDGSRSGRDPRYHQYRWVTERKLHFAQYPFCVACEQEGVLTPANTLDHKIRVKDGADFWDRSNYQGLCSRHHAIKSRSEKGK